VLTGKPPGPTENALPPRVAFAPPLFTELYVESIGYARLPHVETAEFLSCSARGAKPQIRQ
jgi:hypothetical protein